jgi:ketosteroid isomerase-like protein
MNHRAIIERYFRAFRERDLEGLRAILTPDFHHVSSFGEWRDRDAMLQAIWPGVGQSWAVNLQVFGEAPEFVVRYHHESLPGSGRPPMDMAEFVRFAGDKIAEIEVYVGRELPRSEGA